MTQAETSLARSEIRPFQVEVPEEDLVELRRRIAAARWPSRELVPDRSQGVQLATLQALARYWATDYDCGRVAAMRRRSSASSSSGISTWNGRMSMAVSTGPLMRTSGVGEMRLGLTSRSGAQGRRCGCRSG